MDQKMMDRIQALEKRREAGEKVPELDRLYQQVDRREQKGYEAATGTAPKLSFGAKTGIESKAAEDAFKKQYRETGPVTSSYDDAVYQRAITGAKQEARNEIRRETKGKAPGAYAQGGMTASARADGCAQRGKTRGKLV